MFKTKIPFIDYICRFSFAIMLIFPNLTNPIYSTQKLFTISNDFINSYLYPGETAIPMKDVEFEGNQYSLYLVTSNSNLAKSDEGILFDHEVSDWTSKKISLVMVFDSSQRLVTDENTLREIFFSQVGGYLQESDYYVYTFLPADDAVIDDFKNKSKEILFQTAFSAQKAKSILKLDNQIDAYAEVLRVALATPNQVSVEFANDVEEKAKQLLSWKSALDEVIKMEKYANNKQIRETAKVAKKIFGDEWDKAISPTNFKIKGYDVSFANWLDIGNLYLNLVNLEEISKERIRVFEDLAKEARAGNIFLSSDLLKAIDIVSLESRSSTVARGEIIFDFLADHSADLVMDLSEQVLRKQVTDFIWKQAGTRLTGHLLAGAFSSVFVAFSIADVLFNMSSIYENVIIAENAAKITEEINNNINITKDSKLQSKPSYTSLSYTFRELVIGWNLCIAQSFTSYADAIENSRMLKEIAKLFYGKQWEEAVNEFNRYASEGNKKTEELLLFSKIIEYAITLPASRLGLNNPPIIGNVDSSTVMVLDTSGSMDEADITGLSKLQAAQRAAGNIINIASSEAQQSNTITTSLGLVNYNNSAAVNLDLTTDYTSLQKEINNLSAGGGTGMAEGLQTGIGLFGGSSSNEKQMIILLSDGMANIPIDSALSYDEEGIKQEVINLASQAGSQGICVYTIGFGIPGTTGSISWDASIDEEFLMEVAAASGCGSYYNAQDSIQLSNVFVELRHTSMGNVLFERTGQIAQGEEIDLGTVAIPANQELALFTLNWPGSKLELNIQDPAGTPVDENYPGATFALSPSIVSVVLSNPMPGDWRLGILGVDVPEGTTAFNSIVSARVGLTTAAPVSPTPQPAVIPSGSGNTGAVIFLLVAASVGLILFIYVQSKDRTKKAVFNSQLVGVSGLFAGQSIVVRDRFTVGRAAGSNLVLHDPGVSRNHVQFRYANGAWFIQDVGSSAGTYVNGKRVTGQRLSNGDQVQIGNQVFTFHVGGQ